jgi:hypothetical protein
MPTSRALAISDLETLMSTPPRNLMFLGTVFLGTVFLVPVVLEVLSGALSAQYGM